MVFVRQIKYNNMCFFKVCSQNLAHVCMFLISRRIFTHRLYAMNLVDTPPEHSRWPEHLLPARSTVNQRNTKLWLKVDKAIFIWPYHKIWITMESRLNAASSRLVSWCHSLMRSAILSRAGCHPLERSALERDYRGMSQFILQPHCLMRMARFISWGKHIYQ